MNRFWWLGIVILLGCATPVKVHTIGPPSGGGVRSIALLPIETIRIPAGVERRIEPDATRVVGARMVDALVQWSGTPFVGPEETRHWIESDRKAPKPECPGAEPKCISAAIARNFSAGAVLRVTVHRYLSRQGSTASVRRPASVWFELELRGPAGAKLWRGSYNEEQKSLTEDLTSWSRAYRRGFRWVSAENLAAYGARTLVQRLDTELRRWK